MPKFRCYRKVDLLRKRSVVWNIRKSCSSSGLRLQTLKPKKKVYEGVNIVKEEEPLHVMLPANRLKIFTFFFHVRPPEVIKKQILGLFTLMLEHGIQRIVSLISETQLSVELKGTSTSVELLEPIIKS